MPGIRIAILSTLLAATSGCSRFAADNTTPQGAILLLDEAYQKKDVEAAVAAQDFVTRARLMLGRIQPILVKDEALVLQTAETFEVTFRTRIKAAGFPDVTNVESNFVGQDVVAEDLVTVHQERTRAGGATETRKVVVAKGSRGWRVVEVQK